MNAADVADWVGRTTERQDLIAPFPTTALTALVGRAEAPAEGGAVPPGWHWLYFLDTPAPLSTGPDGHPKRGGFLPPIPLERRMWAAGRFEVIEPLTIGASARKTSRIQSVTPKSGGSGEMVFVVLEHLIEQGGRLCIREEQTLVYRAMPDSAAKSPARPGTPDLKPAGLEPADLRIRSDLDPVSLFRFSALTYNGHRIHYDRPYAEKVEHYPGLVAHGPYVAVLLLELASRHHARPVRTFAFRALAPAFADEPLALCRRDAGDAAELWSETPRGVGMRATATFGPEGG